MIQSMTGFGSCEKEGCTVELRSLNHRYLNINIKGNNIPTELDMRLRGVLKQHFHRGHIDVLISMAQETASEISVNTEFISRISEQLKEARESCNLDGDITIDTVLQFKDSFSKSEPAVIGEDIVIEVFDCAVEKLKEMRAKEGETLYGEIASYLDSMDMTIEKIESCSADLSEKMLDKVRTKIRELLGDTGTLEPRLLQEAAFLAQRGDVTEEITRIKSHLSEFRKNLSNSDKIGRKLDFILQELNRESNTISSKADEYLINALVVDFKNLVEKLREQIQNIQ